MQAAPQAQQAKRENSAVFGCWLCLTKRCARFARRVQQAKREEQLAALQKVIEAKEATWQRLNGGQGKISEIKARFDAELAQLQAQRDELQAERSQLIRVRV